MGGIDNISGSSDLKIKKKADTDLISMLASQVRKLTTELERVKLDGLRKTEMIIKLEEQLQKIKNSNDSIDYAYVDHLESKCMEFEDKLLAIEQTLAKPLIPPIASRNYVINIGKLDESIRKLNSIPKSGISIVNRHNHGSFEKSPIITLQIYKNGLKIKGESFRYYSCDYSAAELLNEIESGAYPKSICEKYPNSSIILEDYHLLDYSEAMIEAGNIIKKRLEHLEPNLIKVKTLATEFKSCQFLIPEKDIKQSPRKLTAKSTQKAYIRVKNPFTQQDYHIEMYIYETLSKAKEYMDEQFNLAQEWELRTSLNANSLSQERSLEVLKSNLGAWIIPSSQNAYIHQKEL